LPSEAFFVAKKVKTLYNMNMKSLVDPKKKFGQNFLVHVQTKQKVFDAISDFVVKYPGKPLLEIGPGQGDLTEYMVTLGRKIDILEIDPQAKDVVQARFEVQGVEVVLSDALEEVAKEHSVYFQDTILISNLPFNVGSRILVELGVRYSTTPFMVILQKEVAYKCFTEHADFTLFGAWLNIWWDIKKGFTISKAAFYPSPRVDCAMITGSPKLSTCFDGYDHIKLLLILKKLNSMPNKTVYNNLTKHFTTKEVATELFSNNKLPLTTRLTWENYQQIMKLVYDHIYS
jgi:16S rRNA (adenine1518-N6/adenine1519-N6)-dimethyltransferase